VWPALFLGGAALGAVGLVVARSSPLWLGWGSELAPPSLGADLGALLWSGLGLVVLSRLARLGLVLGVLGALVLGLGVWGLPLAYPVGFALFFSLPALVSSRAAREGRLHRLSWLRYAGWWLVLVGALCIGFCSFGHLVWLGWSSVVLGLVYCAVSLSSWRSRLAWLRRVEAGQVSGLRVTPLFSPPEGLPCVVDAPQDELDFVLLREESQQEVYRGVAYERPLALVPSRLVPEQERWLRNAFLSVLALLVPVIVSLFTLSQRRFSVGESPFDSLLVDVDQDGDLDVLSLNLDSRDVSLLLNNGSGRFAKAVSLPVLLPDGAAPRNLSLLSSENGPSIVVEAVSQDLSDPTLSFFVFQNLGEGHFSPLQALATPPDENRFSLLRDLDLDGDLDRVALTSLGLSATYTGRAGALRVPVGKFGLSSYRLLDLLVKDVNHDEAPDIVFSLSEPSGAFYVFLNGGSGNFLNAEMIPLLDLTGIALGDVNGDGHSDVVATQAGRRGPRVFFGDGDSGLSLSPFGDAPSSQVLSEPRLGDLDRDGDLDLLVLVPSKDEVRVLLNDGNGTFLP
jgi:hypothetical protein